MPALRRKGVRPDQWADEPLHEAVDRGLWAEHDPELLAAQQQVYLDVEGELADSGCGIRPAGQPSPTF